MQVIKRTGELVEFDKDKIYNAILKAMKYGSGIVKEDIALDIANKIHNKAKVNEKYGTFDIGYIETEVYFMLIEHGELVTAKAYENYRSVREFQRNRNTIDNNILGIVDGTNKSALEENSNKNATIASTQRDLIAGEVSKDIARRLKLPTRIVQAHDEGIIHFHDADYFIQNIFNCMLVDLKDMLQNGTCINKKMIEKPKSFQTACTVATQIVQQVANGQYGGQTISLSHLSPFVRISYYKHLDSIKEEFLSTGVVATEEQIKSIAELRLREEVSAGIQTIQFQVNTFSTTNGQAPFLSIFMYISEEKEYEKETAMLIEEMLHQRYLGMKNEVGVYVTPSFPKLLYVLDENNIPKDSEYRYLTDLAVKCVSKRMNPDFISAKKMKENYEGNVFPCMGCRSFLSTWKDNNGNYKWYGRFNIGVVTLNLADIGLSANKDIDTFWNIFDERLELCKEALMLRYEQLKGTLSDISPIHWQHGAISRLEKEESIDKFLNDGYSTLSVGYAGLNECVRGLIGKSITTEQGEKLAVEIMNKVRWYADKWRNETGLGFSVYGSPQESTTFKFATSLRKRFGVIEGITDRDYITNSYHVDVTEEIDAFNKLKFESKFQKISSGGSVSYVESPNMEKNLQALSKLVDFMYDNIQYAEINTKSDYCHICGFDGEILVDDNLEWYCPNCGSKDKNKMNVCRRTCGYLGDNFWNEGRTQEIKERVLHLDNKLFEV